MWYFCLLVPPATCVVKRNVCGLIAIVALCICIGWWRGGQYMQKLSAYDTYYGQAVTLTLVANQDAVYGMHSALSFDGSHVVIVDGTELAGTITISGFGANAVFQGDTIEVSGKLRPGYGSKQGSISFAKLTVLNRRNTPINELRRRFAAGIASALPEPLASFAMGLLIGQRANLPDSVKQDLLMVGLTHIIAVSGYNLTILLHASRKLFAGQSKRIATGLSFALIVIFLLITGLSASIVRAAIVSTLSIMTMYYGRQMKPLNILALAACITAYANPFYIWFDISWYLSFLAFFGVMIVGPLITERLPPKLHESTVIAIGIESIAAEMMSLPIVLFTFGQMSFIGLPANMLVVALVPLAMLLCAVAGIAGMCLPALAGWIAWPAAVLLNYMLDTAHVLAGLPHVFREGIGLSLAEMLLWYLGIGLFIMALWFKTKAKSAILTDNALEIW